MNLKRINSLMLAAVLTCCMLLTSCGSNTGSTPSGNNADSGGEKPVIEFYHGYFHSESEWPVAAEMRKIFDEFAEANKDKYTFKPIALDTGGEGVYNRALQEIADGKFPDIVDTGGWPIVPAAAQAGQIVDLKPHLDSDPDFKAGVGVCYDQNLTDGKIYTVREQVEAVGFWYNEELFNKVGATLPPAWTKPSDFADAVKTLNASADVVTPFALNQGWPTNLLLSELLLTTADGRTMMNSPVTSFTNDAFKNALTFLTDNALMQIETRYFTGAGDSDEQYRDMFINGDAAMLFNGVWEAGALEDDKFKPAVFPADDGKKVGLMSAGTGYVISSNMDQAKIDACIDFVKYMTSKTIAERIVRESIGMAPSTAIDYISLKADTSLSKTTLKMIEACELIQNAAYQGRTFGAVWDGDIESAIAGKYAGLKDGSKTVDVAVDELNQILG